MTTLRRLTILSTTVFLLTASASADRLFLQDGTKVDGTYLGGSGGSIQFRMNDGTVKSYDLSSIQWIYLSQKPATQPAQPTPLHRSLNLRLVPILLPAAPMRTPPWFLQTQVPMSLRTRPNSPSTSITRSGADVGSPPLQWSTELAAYAQKWANHLANDNHCQLDHTVDNKYGENLFGGSGVTYTALFASQDWYGEKQKYTYGVLTDANWYATGHYTQMVWRNTTQIGMGQANCAGGGSVIAAEYYPPGNYMGQKPY